MLKYLIEELGYSANTIAANTCPLACCRFNNKLDSFRYLLEHGAEVNILVLTSFYHIEFWQELITKHEEAVKRVLSNKENVFKFMDRACISLEFTDCFDYLVENYKIDFFEKVPTRINSEPVRLLHQIIVLLKFPLQKLFSYVIPTPLAILDVKENTKLVKQIVKFSSVHDLLMQWFIPNGMIVQYPLLNQSPFFVNNFSFLYENELNEIECAIYVTSIEELRTSISKKLKSTIKLFDIDFYMPIAKQFGIDDTGSAKQLFKPYAENDNVFTNEENKKTWIKVRAIIIPWFSSVPVVSKLNDVAFEIKN